MGSGHTGISQAQRAAAGQDNFTAIPQVPHRGDGQDEDDGDHDDNDVDDHNNNNDDDDLIRG